MNAGAAAELQIFGQDVGRVRPQIRAEEIADRRTAEFGEVFGEFLLGVAPRKVVVRLREAELGEAVHHLRPGERLGEEDASPDACAAPRR